MDIKLLRRLSVGLCAVSAAFSLLCASFAADVSALALPLSLLFTLVVSFCSLRRLFADGRASFLPAFRELLQYEPYVLLVAFVLRRAGEGDVPFALDVAQVALWLAAGALVLVILHFIAPKRAGRVCRAWGEFEEARRDARPERMRGLRRVGAEAVGWLDALVQAVFMVLLLNVFLVQLYEIPSESMVPEFLVKDRVVVFKVLNGPKFPLSDVGLPPMRSYDRGDIVVFRNPHYPHDRRSEVRTFVSQLVYMCTLTMKNINVDESGRPKADPLVKRVVGLPGEQLMMQDGVLYARTAASDEWRVVEEDKSWACWDLNAVRPSVKKGIIEFKLTEEQVSGMEAFEEKRRGLDVSLVRLECESLADSFDSLRKVLDLPQTELGSSFDVPARDRFVHSLFSRNALLTHRLLSSPNGAEWFRAFMTGWSARDFGGDLYAEANFRLNLMVKLTVGRLVVRNAQMLAAEIPASEQAVDATRLALMDDAQEIFNYVCLLDLRNMPVFPPSRADGTPDFIPDGSYFMMGDNRFNSMDMRHSYEEHLAALDGEDPFSATYPSNMAPQYVPRGRILGTTAYRFWPLSRRGVPGHTGM